MDLIGNWSIRRKIIGAIMLCTMLGMSTVAVTYFSYQVRQLQSSLESTIAVHAEMLSRNLSASLIFQDSHAADELLSSFKADENIKAALVRDSKHQVFSVFFSEAYISPLAAQGGRQKFHAHSEEREGLFDRLRDSDDYGFKEYRQKIILDGEILGELQLLYSREKLSEHIHKVLYEGSLVFFIACALAFVFAVGLQRNISRPIVALHQLSKKVAGSNDYSQRAKVFSRDEVGELAESLNSMLEKIEHRDSYLEKQVMQRTAELEKLAEDFRHRAYHDSLTGLPNRALLNESFNASVAAARRNKNQFGLLLLDLDNFKTINDTLGHDFGDELLKLLAKRIVSMVRGDDLVCRLGGDEFVVLVRGIVGPAQLLSVGQKVLREVSKPMQIKDRVINNTVSIGAAIYPNHGEDLITLKRNADIAMYQSKGSGKNQCSLFEQQMEEGSVQRLVVQSELQAAIKQRQLEVYYQPKIDAQQSCLISAEALVRWRHPEEGFLAPDSFIPFAEENGLIKEIDYYVIETVCQQQAQWLKQGLKISVAVNLSGIHFRDKKIVHILQQALTQFGLDPSSLEVELTEAVLIQDPEAALQVLKDIRKLGIKVSLDDFGVGYSSLNYLRTLPLDVVKLDKSFISNIDHNETDEKLTRAIIALAQELGLDVVAEGVETRPQKFLLLELGCRQMQGYYFSRPLPAVEFWRWYQQFEQADNGREKLS